MGTYPQLDRKAAEAWMRAQQARLVVRCASCGADKIESKPCTYCGNARMNHPPARAGTAPGQAS